MNTNAASSSGSENTEKEAAALEESQAEQNEAQTNLEKGRLNLGSARKAVADQEAKLAAAKKLVANPPKDADDASRKAAQDAVLTEQSALDTRRKEADTLKVDVDALTRAAANADSKVNTSRTALGLVQGKVRSSTTSSGGLVKAGSQEGTGDVSTAVTNIVQMVLRESGRGEQCNALLAQLSMIPANERPIRIAAACSDDQKAVLEAAAQFYDPANVRPESQLFRAAPSFRLLPTPKPPPPN